MEGFLDEATSMAFVCGPNRPRQGQPGFCELWCGNPRKKVVGFLSQLGFTPDRILTEMW
jgi:hypothetical protein